MATKEKITKKQKLEYALKLLSERKVTISKAAEIAGINVWSMIEEIRKAKIQWVDDEIIKHDLEEFR